MHEFLPDVFRSVAASLCFNLGALSGGSIPQTGNPGGDIQNAIQYGFGRFIDSGKSLNKNIILAQ